MTALFHEDDTIHEHAVRKLRFMRAIGDSRALIEEYAFRMESRLGIDAHKAMAESISRGETNGYPYLLAAHKRRRDASP